MMKEAISKIEKGHHLDTDEAEQLLCHIFQNETQEPELKSLLGLLIQKGESVSEIIGFARAMRKSMKSIQLIEHNNEIIMDVCGTGGVKKDRFNLSTASAFVLAASGVKVAKHGNYGSKKLNGSFNFLEALENKTIESIKIFSSEVLINAEHRVL